MKPTTFERISAYAALAFVTALSILPLLVLVFTSLKGDDEFGLGRTTILPSGLQFDNYVRALGMAEWGLFFRNSAIVTAAAVGAAFC